MEPQIAAADDGLMMEVDCMDRCPWQSGGQGATGPFSLQVQQLAGSCSCV